MSNQDRLAQLRVLRKRLEGMPASADRDWMLDEVRSRLVDLDTGIAPRPLRSLESAATLDSPAPAPGPARPPVAKPPAAVKKKAPIPRQAPAPRAAPAVEPPAWEVTLPPASDRGDRIDLLALDGLLNLDDDAPAADGEDSSKRPWAGGLRG